MIDFRFWIVSTGTSAFLVSDRFNHFRRCWLRSIFWQSVANWWVAIIRFCIFVSTFIYWILPYVLTYTESLFFRIITWHHWSNFSVDILILIQTLSQNIWNIKFWWRWNIIFWCYWNIILITFPNFIRWIHLCVESWQWRMVCKHLLVYFTQFGNRLRTERILKPRSGNHRCAYWILNRKIVWQLNLTKIIQWKSLIIVVNCWL